MNENQWHFFLKTETKTWVLKDTDRNLELLQKGYVLCCSNVVANGESGLSGSDVIHLLWLG
jgi:hypothetical protein